MRVSIATNLIRLINKVPESEKIMEGTENYKFSQAVFFRVPTRQGKRLSVKSQGNVREFKKWSGKFVIC